MTAITGQKATGVIIDDPFAGMTYKGVPIVWDTIKPGSHHVATHSWWRSTPSPLCKLMSRAASRAQAAALTKAFRKLFNTGGSNVIHTVNIPMRRGYHFVAHTSQYGRKRRIPKDGVWWKANPKKAIRCCRYGMHASPHADMAAEYMPSDCEFLCLVDVRYVRSEQNDKFAGRHRRIVARMTYTRYCEIRNEVAGQYSPYSVERTQAERKAIRAEFRLILKQARRNAR